ncbi:MAG: hypothetical protein IPL67_11505 [Ignavibacteria bacterium]|nr:hypothetical protein [Ignavibacteria bacterium]
MAEIIIILAKLLGVWEGIQGSGIYHEEWRRLSNNLLEGRAYMVKKGEITNPENLKIVIEDDEVYYVADVSHNEAPVRFRMTSFSETILVFENPSHDFPQKITYDLAEEGWLKAVIEAEREGKIRKVEFRLKKTD